MSNLENFYRRAVNKYGGTIRITIASQLRDDDWPDEIHMAKASDLDEIRDDDIIIRASED